MKTSDRYPNVFIHETSLVDADFIGEETQIWAFCNILKGARIGKNCQICDRVFIENDAKLGDSVTVKCGVSIWSGITIEDGVFVGPGVEFTNDLYPRSRRNLAAYPQTTIKQHASLGAGAIILAGLSVGAYSMIGAGAVVTRDVQDFALMVGNPGRRIGWACICGVPLITQARHNFTCRENCGRSYTLRTGNIHLIQGSADPCE